LSHIAKEKSPKFLGAFLAPFFVGSQNNFAVWNGFARAAIQVKRWNEFVPVIDPGIGSDCEVSGFVFKGRFFVK
jgi:hypothetical protein